jgi:hypothetical protein
MRFWRALAIVTGAVGVIAIPVAWFMVANWFEEAMAPEPWPDKPQIAVTLPDGTGRLELYRRQIHPFQAEFERRIVVTRADGSKFKRAIHDNTGGRWPIKLYWYKRTDSGGPYLRFEDYHGESVISVAEGWVQRLVRYDGSAAFVWVNGDFGVSSYRDKNGKVHAYGMNGHDGYIEYVERQVPDVILAGPGDYLGVIADGTASLVFTPGPARTQQR